MLYKSLIKPLLFSISPETAHHLVMNQLKFAFRMPLVKGLFQRAFCVTDKSLETEVAGLRFPNRVGLAAGFDKDAVAFDELSAFGFGFIEIGTVTPKPQDGNPKPRLFRLPADQALINRMGFNNSGVDVVRKRLESRSGKLIIGGNIGKNKVTPNENAVDDYLICFRALRDCVDYFVVNISSPNTPGLRELQDREPLIALLSAVMAENRKGIQRPVFLKIAPDLTTSQVDDIIGIVLETGLAGMVISNTTISRDGLKTPAGKLNEIGAGGLSGKPVFQRSTELVRYVSEKSQKRFAIIASGGIVSAEDAIAKLEAGADLVQLYTGFIYEGPGLVKKILRALLKN
jgi:dihydroorotate dehydrogenase